ncbi:hypothetical protein GWI33_019164 [Rhynchophorus ferrugineus]|uniref:Cuticle protein n=1 Tax=Rhynchophorus ferrugineus TaxID=354439 RepID=A0A834M4H4_RHYFE|nr:hypothetical protein GWI33_019164 [Rhynchophorus ferrugineus]
MKSFVAVAFFTCLAVSNAGWLAGPSAKILQGPSSKTTLVGPEGSVIAAHAPGGQIIHEEQPGFVAHAAPIVAPAPVVSYAAPAVAAAAPSTVVAHSSAYQKESVLVAGPSGTIATGGSPVVAHATPVVASVAPIAPAVGAFGYAAHDIDNNGHEGQYVHDYTETLYDDGSYKPHAY